MPGSGPLKRLVRVVPAAIAATAVIAITSATTATTSGGMAAASTVTSTVTSTVSGTVSGTATRAAATPAKLCIGAGALDPKHSCPKTQKLRTSPDFAKNDISEGISKCLMLGPNPSKLLVCHRGDTSSPKKRIALFGNSHAGHWLDALDVIGKKKHWEIDSYILAYCDVSLTDAPDYCAGFRDVERPAVLAQHYDLVIMGSDKSPDTSPDTYMPTLQLLVGNGSNVLVIRDTPAPGDPYHLVPDCIAEHLKRTSACDGKPKDWIHQDFLTAAAKQLGDPHVFTANVDRYICTKRVCPAVVGGVIPYRDENHLTATYTRTLIPYLQPSIEKAMP